MTETTKEYRIKVTGSKVDHIFASQKIDNVVKHELRDLMDVELYEHSFAETRKGVLTGLGVRK